MAWYFNIHEQQIGFGNQKHQQVLMKWRFDFN